MDTELQATTRPAFPTFGPQRSPVDKIKQALLARHMQRVIGQPRPTAEIPAAGRSYT